ncbi:BTAD domain-containing putative transcriptional regulator [Actinophytocola sp. NPDC049390]|uniref:BTAD domain-containing putative transcriptional regulator n=1 Tax=Actinophytocola sp. NPDC049390 TaxID=3363894 RepID=UPI0037B99097
MRFGLLGPLAVWTDHGEPVTVPGRKVRALLANLLVNAGRPMSVDRLVEDLWGAAAPADPTAALHVRVSQLRRALANAEPGGRELVVSQPPGYVLRTDAVDTVRFAALVERAGTTADPRARAGVLAEALSLWRGPVLADFADDEFTEAARARWEELRLAAVEAHAEARLALGEHRELVGELGEQVAGHPYRERLRAAHMRALHRAGRTGEALDSFQSLRRGLADELGLDPGPELTALHQAMLSGDPAEDAPSPAPRPMRRTTNLPAPVTELIGREHAIARVRELLTGSRLVTLTGPGGVGKTSVAGAVALAAAEVFPDGAWLIDLTTWDGSGDLGELVLSVLSIPGAQQPASALREHRTLLVLDNCEHVLDPVADLLGTLLPAASGVRVLATSREPLRLRGEARFDLPPLDVPDTDDPERLAHTAAVRLFLVRAGLTADPEVTTGVAEICRRLDGLPLALELAATRVPALGVADLAARLQVPHDRFGLLGAGPRDAPARQRTLAAVIDWSWQLLTDDERTVLRRLAVHVGGCTLAAAEAVCAVDGVLDLLSGLVDRSLVARVDGSRYRLLESVHAYCVDRLRDAGDEEEVRRRHADHYLALAEQAELRGPGQREWLRRLDAEAANMRTALDTFRRAGAAAAALRLTTALGWYWLLRGRLVEGRRMLATALEITGDAPTEVRAAAEFLHAGMTIRQGQASPELAAEALRTYEKVASPVELAGARWFLAATIIDFGDTALTGELLAQALDVFRDAGDRWGEAAVLSTRAMLAHMRADPVALEQDARRSAQLFGALGDDWGVLQATDWLIGLADMTGDHAEAERLSREGLRIAEDLGLWADVAGRLSWLAWTAVQTADYAAAQEYAAQARKLTIEQEQRVGEVFATISLAFAARRAGEPDVAEEHLRWLLSTAREQQSDEGNPPYLTMVLVELGLLAEQRARRPWRCGGTVRPSTSTGTRTRRTAWPRR